MLAIFGHRLLRDAEHRRRVMLAARRCFRAVGIDEDVTVAFVSDIEMRALNRRYRRIDQTTDVLSFAAWEGEPMPGDEARLGDLVISLDAMRRQARACGHAIDVECAVLVTHGLMHLLGLDHERTDEEAARQAACECTILAIAGYAPEAALAARTGHT